MVARRVAHSSGPGSGNLGKEVKDFGVRVTAVELGSFRTDWAARSLDPRL